MASLCVTSFVKLVRPTGSGALFFFVKALMLLYETSESRFREIEKFRLSIF